jgi:hypothetical protein
VTERLKKDIIKLVIDEVVIDGEKLKLSATIPLPNKIHPVRNGNTLRALAISNGVHERKMDKTDPFNYIQGHPERSRMSDIPGPLRLASARRVLFPPEADPLWAEMLGLP